MCHRKLCKMVIVTGVLLHFLFAARVVGEASKCEKLAALASWKDQNTVVETTYKTLTGTWISEGCETRPGPEYVFRSYIFNSDGQYTLIQHHYWDDSCSSPKLTVVSYGRIQLRNALVQPGASNGFTRPLNVTVTPQDSAAARELDVLVANECPGRYWKSWKPNEEHLVFDNKFERRPMVNLWSRGYPSFANNDAVNNNNDPNAIATVADLSCLGSLKWTFNELKLLKIQLRPVLHTHHKHIITQHEMELLLGDIHSNPRRREFYSPTSFQGPLLKHTRGENITIRKRQYMIKNLNSPLIGNLKHAPHLNQKPHLPPYIWGQWISTRCEVRPLDVYLLRRFTFYEEDSTWAGEHKFFSDPFCTYPKFVVTASGRFVLSGENDKMKGVTNINFQIDKATMMVMEYSVITDMRLADGFCGLGEWKVNTAKDLSRTGGCINLGIVIPSVRFDVVKLEMDYKGSWLLFLGQADTNNLPNLEIERPTAFQLPLVKCGEAPYSTHTLTDYIARKFSLSTGNSIYSSGFIAYFCLFSFVLMR